MVSFPRSYLAMGDLSKIVDLTILSNYQNWIDPDAVITPWDTSNVGRRFRLWHQKCFLSDNLRLTGSPWYPKTPGVIAERVRWWWGSDYRC